MEVRLVNDGELPTHGGIARHIKEPGWVIRVELAGDRLLDARPMQRVDNVPGHGSVSRSWLVRGQPGERVRFSAYCRRYGTREIEIELREHSADPGDD